MTVTTQQQAQAGAFLGTRFPRTLMQALEYAMNYLAQYEETEPMAQAELEEVSEAYFSYINLCLGLSPDDEPTTEAESGNRWGQVWDAAADQQSGDPT